MHLQNVITTIYIDTSRFKIMKVFKKMLPMVIIKAHKDQKLCPNKCQLPLPSTTQGT